MRRLRYRLAHWLVGPFVNIPERDGVWVVSRMGRAHTIIEADEFRLEMARDLNVKRFGNNPDVNWYPPSSKGTFTGTVKGH